MTEVSRSTLERYITVLRSGLTALLALDEHAEMRAGIPGLTSGVDVCVDCMRYAVAVGLQMKTPQSVLAMRCAEAQVWQRQVWAAYALLDEIGETVERLGGDDSLAQARWG